ncbi:MAG: HNH endonuclease [Anaerolineae bacterium]
MDHVVPKVRGGETTWDNVVCACKTCNARKGAKSLEEASMQLLKKPARPEYVAVVLLSRASTKDVWDKYLPQTSAASA